MIPLVDGSTIERARRHLTRPFELDAHELSTMAQRATDVREQRR